MFGFGKRKSSYEGLLSTLVSVAMSLKTDMAEISDAVSLAAYEGAKITLVASALGVPDNQIAHFKEHMFLGALGAFGDSMAIKTNWLFSYDLAEAALVNALPAEALMKFYHDRAATIPWHLSEPEFGLYANGLGMAVGRMIREQSPKWRHEGL